MKLMDLYKWLAAAYPADENAGDFFSRLSLDEQSHGDLIKYQQRVVRKSPKEFGDVEIDEEAIRNALSEIEQFRASNHSLKDAIRFAMNIENSTAESYFNSVMHQSNQDFAKLLKQLSATCSKHCQEVLEFARAHDMD